jgi:hypothetical protein
MKPLLLSLSDMETSKTVMVAPALGHFKSDGLTPGAAKFAYKASVAAAKRNASGIPNHAGACA